MEKNIIALTDQDGNSINYELIDIIKENDKIYAIFYPTEVGDTEVLILRVEEAENPEQSLYVIEENNNIRQKVYEMFKEKYKDKIIFND